MIPIPISYWSQLSLDNITFFPCFLFRPNMEFLSLFRQKYEDWPSAWIRVTGTSNGGIYDGIHRVTFDTINPDLDPWRGLPASSSPNGDGGSNSSVVPTMIAFLPQIPFVLYPSDPGSFEWITTIATINDDPPPPPSVPLQRRRRRRRRG